MNEKERRLWNKRFADRLQQLTGCRRKAALEGARAAENPEDISPEEAAECEASYWADDREA